MSMSVLVHTDRLVCTHPSTHTPAPKNHYGAWQRLRFLNPNLPHPSKHPLIHTFTYNHKFLRSLLRSVKTGKVLILRYPAIDVHPSTNQPTNQHTHTHTWIQAHTHMNTHAYKHTHTWAHTWTHTHTHTNYTGACHCMYKQTADVEAFMCISWPIYVPTNTPTNIQKSLRRLLITVNVGNDLILILFICGFPYINISISYKGACWYLHKQTVLMLKMLICMAKHLHAHPSPLICKATHLHAHPAPPICMTTHLHAQPSTPTNLYGHTSTCPPITTNLYGHTSTCPPITTNLYGHTSTSPTIHTH